MYLELLIIALLIGANALFAMAEFAVISAKKYRLDQRARRGDRGAEAALELARRPTRFLSTIQIGITLVGILVGAFSGVTLSAPLANLLSAVSIFAPYHQVLATAIIVVVVTYFTLVFGELVPKRIALSRPESIASRLAHFMQILSALAYPAVRLLSLSTDSVIRITHQTGAQEPTITEEEIQVLIEQGTRAGILEEAEEDMIKRVIRLGDRRVSSLMTPRPDIVAIDVHDSPETIYQIITESGHTRFPVYRDSVDVILGIISVRDLLEGCILGKKNDLEGLLTPPLFVPESLPVLKVLEEYHKKGTKIALVVDEYASIAGLITPHDIMEEIVGEIPEEYESPRPLASSQPDGSWLVDGMMRLDEFREIFPVEPMPGENKGYFQTLGGFVMTGLGRIPEAGDAFEWSGLRFEITKMKGSRVSQVRVIPLGTKESSEDDSIDKA
jgi:putative hemolysin